MQSAKGILRTRAQKDRESYYTSLKETQRRQVSQQIKTRFTEFFDFPKTHWVSGFWPTGSEIDPRPILEALAAKGQPLALPVVTGAATALTFRAWKPGGPLKPGAFNIQEPLPHASQVEPDVLLVPLVAFDGRGHRLGYGAGHYDRTLINLSKKKPVMTIGLAFEVQRVNELPIMPHDQKLDFVVTDLRIYDFT